MSFSIQELERKLANIVLIGEVIDVDHERLRAKVQAGKTETPWVRWATDRAGNSKTRWDPSVGEQVICFSPSGILEMGIILGAISSESNIVPTDSMGKHVNEYPDGGRVEYDFTNGQINITVGGGAKTVIKSTGGFDLTGDLNVNGAIKATGDITDHTRSMEADRSIFNGHDHYGVKSGKSSTKLPSTKQ